MKDEEDFTDLKDFRDFVKIFMKRDLKSSDYLISFKIQNKYIYFSDSNSDGDG